MGILCCDAQVVQFIAHELGVCLSVFLDHLMHLFLAKVSCARSLLQITQVFYCVLVSWRLLDQIFKVKLFEFFNSIERVILDELLCKEVEPFMPELFDFIENERIIFILRGGMEFCVYSVDRLVLTFKQLSQGI